MPAQRKLLGYCFKFLLGAGMVALLLKSGALDPARLLRAFARHPGLCALAFCAYSTVVGLAGIRWLLLVRGIGLTAAKAPAPRILSLHLVGVFFNSLLPGGTGGDLVKGFYLFRENAPGDKAKAIACIVADRLVGLYGLLFLGASMLLLNPDLAWKNPVLRANSLFYLAVFAGVTLFIPGLFLYGGRRARVLTATGGGGMGEGGLSGPGLEGGKRMPGLFSRFRASSESALSAYRKTPYLLLLGLVLTVGIHCLLVLTYFAFARALEIEAPFLLHGFVVPVLTLVNGLPLSPAGIGLGEAAGKYLYAQAGVPVGGAEIVALVHMAVIGFTLLCAPFYFFYRSGPGSADRPEPQ